MRSLIDAVGPCSLRRERNRFWMLVRSIISQQLSTGAARSIRKRLESTVEDQTAEAVLKLRTNQFRKCGVSPQKSKYIVGLARAVRDEQINLSNIGRKSDESVISELVQVKGIGVWTAQMFLIFSLGRPDVLPTSDQGVRSAIRLLYQLDNIPDETTMILLAEPWRPFASVASWYCWRCLDLRIKTTAA